MSRLYFVPQDTLDGWSDQGVVDIEGEHLVELASSARFAVREAVHFVKLESGDDTHALLHKVKSLDQVRALGAEHYMTSVLLGDTVYEVKPGWIAEDPAGGAAATNAVPPPPARAQPSRKFEVGNQEADMLARLLLDKLS